MWRTVVCVVSMLGRVAQLTHHFWVVTQEGEQTFQVVHAASISNSLRQYGMADELGNHSPHDVGPHHPRKTNLEETYPLARAFNTFEQAGNKLRVKRP